MWEDREELYEQGGRRRSGREVISAGPARSNQDCSKYGAKVLSLRWRMIRKRSSEEERGYYILLLPRSGKRCWHDRWSLHTARALLSESESRHWELSTRRWFTLWNQFLISERPHPSVLSCLPEKRSTLEAVTRPTWDHYKNQARRKVHYGDCVLLRGLTQSLSYQHSPQHFHLKQ